MQRPMVMLVDSASPAVLPDFVQTIQADVTVATSVGEGFALSKGRAVTAAVLRPGGSGQQAANAARRLRSEPNMAQVPFAVVGQTVIQAQQAYANGAADFWREPLDARQFEVGVNALLARAVPLPARTRAPRTILVADDDLFFLRRVADLLEADGYQTLKARTGTEALHLLETAKVRPSLCVMDLFMPGLGGIELLQRLREMPAWATIPVIAVSGVRRDKAVVEELARLGVTDFIDKAVVAIDSVAAIADEYLAENGEKRRRDRRVSTLALADFRRAPEEPWLTGLVANLSTTGAFVRTLTPPKEGALVHLRVELPQAPNRLGTRARVAWVRSRDAGSPEPHGMGVEFTEFSDDAHKALESWIQVGSALPTPLSDGQG